ncbi:MAG: leucyl aminopeptidase [Bacteroidota bacterium]
MTLSIKLSAKTDNNTSILYLANKKTKWATLGFDKKEITYIDKKIKADEKFVIINQFTRVVFIQLMEEFDKKENYQKLENLRGVGNKICTALNSHKYTNIQLTSVNDFKDELLAVAEGCALSNYQFLKYRTDKKETNTLKEIHVISKNINKHDIEFLNTNTEAVFKARNLVNEPQSFLDAVTFANEMKAMGKAAGFKVEVLNKKQIEALKMGGLLSVNLGSKTPPTFTIMEWKPAKAKNKKPLVLVGKGVVYDTGGLSLKPTPNSMDTMKCDMAGGAAVAASMYAIAKSNLPYHVIALVPATDNRPGENAYTPGDVITMYDGKTVEVLNTDAEGRMLLADALAYAKKYDPELVLDFATLTGAAAAAIGQYGIVCMGTATEKQKIALKESGNNVYERLVEFPFWDEYAKLIKSDIADMKNIGGAVGGAITAGKFLEKYTDYNWMHFDIAGPAFISSNDSYRGKNATGVAVRFIVDYVKNLSKK